MGREGGCKAGALHSDLGFTWKLGRVSGQCTTSEPPHGRVVLAPVCLSFPNFTVRAGTVLISWGHWEDYTFKPTPQALGACSG